MQRAVMNVIWNGHSLKETRDVRGEHDKKRVITEVQFRMPGEGEDRIMYFERRDKQVFRMPLLDYKLVTEARRIFSGASEYASIFIESGS